VKKIPSTALKNILFEISSTSGAEVAVIDTLYVGSVMDRKKIVEYRDQTSRTRKRLISGWPNQNIL